MWNRLIEFHNRAGLMLNHPADDDSIESLADLVEDQLPASFANFLAAHNGQQPESTGLFGCYRMLSCREMEHWYDVYQQYLENDRVPVVEYPLDPRVAQGFIWNPGWLFFAIEDGGGNFLVIDFSPEEDGTTGQILLWEHEQLSCAVIAESFDELAKTAAQSIESGCERISGGGFRLRFEQLPF